VLLDLAGVGLDHAFQRLGVLLQHPVEELTVLLQAALYSRRDVGDVET
jgi:hypothetical protein